MLTPNDVERLTSSGAVADFFSQSLGYKVDPVSYEAADLGIPEAPARLIRHSWVELLSDYQRQFQVYRMEVDSMRRTDFRAILEPFYRKHPAGNYLFAFTKDYSEHAFVSPLRVLADDPAKTKLRLRTLRVDRGNVYHTDVETLTNLRITPGEQSPQAIWDQHRAAFDVERVNKAFFDEYASCFKEVVKPAALKTLNRDEDAAHKFTQLLFNRLMFCWFLQKKGWLGKEADQNYLLALLDRANTPRKVKDGKALRSMYHDYLTFLFFEVLCSPEDERRKHFPTDPDVGTEAPFLNGGLFERGRLDERIESAPRLKQLPNSVLKSILRDLFARYNFTVEESTSLDVQVALDPELLGSIFERLVTGRHETGSYYTPRPVVQFMCREALKGYLKEYLPGESEAIASLVDHHEVSGLSVADAKMVAAALDRVKVCDPACGSGAYLLGMLHELVDLSTLIYNPALRLEPRSLYDHKLSIIQNNLYGVDIDDFAVNIARLRLWLSLVVENEETDWRKVEPLPNLDFKIETGDSLTAPDPQAMPSLFRRVLLQHADRLAELKGDYLRAHGEGKKQLARQIRDEEAELRDAFSDSPAPNGSHDWRVAFAEVFSGTDVPSVKPSPQNAGKAHGQDAHATGFDVILANPPYVRADAQFKHLEDEDERQDAIARWKGYRSALLQSRIYETLYEKWDLYLPFLERAHQLLRPEGRMVFIISDAYNAAKYAKKSHEFFLTNANIERIDYCSEIPLFEAGVSNTILHFAKTAPDPAHQPVRVRRWGEGRDDFEHNAVVLPTAQQVEFGAALFKADGTRAGQTTAGAMELGRICYISYGLRANADDRYWRGEFVTADLVSSVKDRRHPKPFIEGKDLTRWWIRRVRYLEWGTNRAPSKFARPTFPELHEAEERLIALVVASGAPPVAFDDRQRFTTHTSCIFVPWHYLKGVRNKSIKKTAKYRNEVKSDEAPPAAFREELEKLSRQFSPKYLLAVMNSTYAKDWLAARRRSKIHVYPDDWKQLPIAPISMEDQQQFVKLVDAILAEFKLHGYPLPPAAVESVAELEREIDEKVAALYES